MICRSAKLCSPCPHPYLNLPMHLTDPCCLGPYCACLSVCLFTCVRVWVRVHSSKHYRCTCAYVCIACACVCQSPVAWVCARVRMSVWGAPRDHSGRSARGTHAQDQAWSGAELALHDCRVPMLRSIHPLDALACAHVGQTYATESMLIKAFNSSWTWLSQIYVNV